MSAFATCTPTAARCWSWSMPAARGTARGLGRRSCLSRGSRLRSVSMSAGLRSPSMLATGSGSACRPAVRVGRCFSIYLCLTCCCCRCAWLANEKVPAFRCPAVRAKSPPRRRGADAALAGTRGGRGDKLAASWWREDADRSTGHPCNVMRT